MTGPDEVTQCPTAEQRIDRALAEYRGELAERRREGLGPPDLNLVHVRVPRWAIGATGSPMRGIVLGQLLYWLVGCSSPTGKRRAHPPDPGRGLGDWWVAKPAAELAAEVGATAKQAEKALAALRRAGWIHAHPMRYVHRGRHRGLVVSHIWPGERLKETVEDIGSDPPYTMVGPWAMTATGHDAAAALVLCRLWRSVFQEKARVAAGTAAPPVVERRAELAEQLALSGEQVKRALRVLRSGDLVERGRGGQLHLDVERCLGFRLLHRRKRP